MSYLTPAEILDHAAHVGAGYRPRQYEASANMSVAPAHLHNLSSRQSTSRTWSHESPVSTHYADYAPPHDASITREVHHSDSFVQRHKLMPIMGLNEGSSYAPASLSVPISSFPSHDPYATAAPVTAPLYDRRNSEDTGPFFRGTHSGPTKRKGSGGGVSYLHPDCSNLPNCWNTSQEMQKQFEYPDYLNLPPELRRNPNGIPKQLPCPGYSNLPPEYRTNHTQFGPIRSSGHIVPNQNPYPCTSPSDSASADYTKRRRGDSQYNRYPADPFIIVRDGRGPTNHIRVPQRVFYDETDLNSCMSYSKPITFRMKNFAELGVRLSDCLDENHLRHPNIEDKDAKLFNDDEIYREIRLKIVWPGYYEYPFTRRIRIRKGEMTRISMLFNVVTAIADFVKKIQNDRDCICERGLEKWKLSGRERLDVDQLILTGIVHRGGPNWQPEIWCPALT